MSSQKPTTQDSNALTDTFGRSHTYLRISLTDRCNLRCGYCMPPEGIDWIPREEVLTFEEIERLARIFAEMGVTKIRLTGGEPTVRKGIVNLVSRIKAIDGINKILLTTNGTTLLQLGQELKDAGVNGLNVSLDTLDPEKYKEITLRDEFDRVWQGLQYAQELGFEPLKLNVVAIKDFNDNELLDFVRLTKEMPINVRFIEFMPFEGNGWSRAGVLSYQEMLDQIGTEFEINPIETEPSAVAKDFAVTGHQGTVSFVTSMTENFCSTCNRLRLTADGQLKTCLFFAPETSLRDLLRAGANDSDVKDLISSTVLKKRVGHPPMDNILGVRNDPMIKIGG